jgi:hypothetical protein
MRCDLTSGFQERLAEVETYLDFLSTLEAQAQQGPPQIKGAKSPITPQQQRILYSSVYLQLYNLIEATMSFCIKAIEDATKDTEHLKPGDLSDSLRREWVRAVARTHTELTPDHRLDSALQLCNHLVASLPIKAFDIDKRSGGNWDDSEIEAFSKRLDIPLDISPPVYSAIKQPFGNDLGALALVKQLRNRLAHGSISFVQCAEDITVERLIELKDRTVNYLRAVVDCFTNYLENFEYMLPEKRPE